MSCRRRRPDDNRTHGSLDTLLRERFRVFHADLRRDFAGRIAAGQRVGSIADAIDPDTEAAFIVAGMRGVGYQWLLDPDDFDASASFALTAVSLDRLRAR